MEVTKWLKPSINVSRIGDSASVQAVTRVNAEQAVRRPRSAWRRHHGPASETFTLPSHFRTHAPQAFASASHR